MPSTNIAICKALTPRKTVVRGANLSIAKHLCKATHDCLYLVHKERCNLQDPDINPRKTEERGGWNMPSIKLKCKTILYNRIHMVGSREELMHKWALPSKLANPPNLHQVPATLP